MAGVICGWGGDVGAAGGQGPAGDAGRELLDVPVGCLLGAVMRAAARGEVALAYSPFNCGNTLWVYCLGQDAALMMAREG